MTRPLLNCSGVLFTAYGVGDAPSLPGPGVYMFCRREASGERTVLYVGETENLRARLGPAHERWDDALARGMDEVLVNFLAEAPDDRMAAEALLLDAYAPPLNRRGAATPMAAFAARQPASAAMAQAGAS